MLGLEWMALVGEVERWMTLTGKEDCEWRVAVWFRRWLLGSRSGRVDLRQRGNNP